jgi:poly(hydroxyalkanoate) depolymerase family esterase
MNDRTLIAEDTGAISQIIKTSGSMASCALAASLVLLLAMSPGAFATNVVAVSDFGSNPGNLSMFKYVPDKLPPSAPLVVVMHGCTQHAATFAKESGWTQLADGLRFALVLPETDKPLANGCFTWYQTSDATRDQGEALSIKQMVDKMKSDHDIDPKRVYATGLSAGGAMTSVMLAAYPDVFAGGAIVAGIPYGCAKTLIDGFQCMSTGHPSAGPLIGNLPQLPPPPGV